MHLGEVVFTGNPNRKKKKDFVFGTLNKKSKGSPIDKSLVEEFLQVHEIDGTPVESWEYWRGKFRSGVPVPVFWIMDQQNRPVHFGLSMLFRLPYQNTVVDLLGEDSGHMSSSPDLAEVIFGHLEEGEQGNGGLKGRVAFEALVAQDSPEPLATVKTVLGSPKPSFFPNYLEQKNKDLSAAGKVAVDDARRGMQKYSTYNDSTNLRGWKRYPVRKDGGTPNNPVPPSDNVAVEFSPLPAGTIFKGRIRVHNLRPRELGALLWTLTWGNDSALRHSVGMAKPLGYGSVQIRLSAESLAGLRSNLGVTPELGDLLKEFEDYMEGEVPQWRHSSTLTELLAMADPDNSANPALLEYPVLSVDDHANHFHDHKNAGRYLLPYTQLSKQKLA